MMLYLFLLIVVIIGCLVADFILEDNLMFKELIYTWLWKGLEILLVAILGYWVFILIESIFATFWAIVGLSIVMYYWGALVKPYIDAFRKWIYSKITGIDETDFKQGK